MTEADIIENWDYQLLPIAEGDDLYRLLEVIASENKRIDLDIEEIYDDRFLGTATGAELEKIGKLVGVVKKEDEQDDKLRKRIRGAFAAQASDTTYDSFASAALSILEADADSVTFLTPPDTSPKVVELRTDSVIIEENPLTESELQVLLNGALSADARAKITITGTFAFAGDDTSLEGWNEGTWSSAI